MVKDNDHGLSQTLLISHLIHFQLENITVNHYHATLFNKKFDFTNTVKVWFILSIWVIDGLVIDIAEMIRSIS